MTKACNRNAKNTEEKNIFDFFCNKFICLQKLQYRYNITLNYYSILKLNLNTESELENLMLFEFCISVFELLFLSMSS